MLSEVGAHATTESKHPGAAGINNADTGSSTEAAFRRDSRVTMDGATIRFRFLFLYRPRPKYAGPETIYLLNISFLLPQVTFGHSE
jgi:hypothetical protein